MLPKYMYIYISNIYNSNSNILNNKLLAICNIINLLINIIIYIII